MDKEMIIKKHDCRVKVDGAYESFALQTPYTPWYEMPKYNWVKYRRVGDYVEIRVLYDSTTAFKMPDWTNLDVGILPVGFRPSRYYESRILTCEDNSRSAPYTKFDIGTDGQIYLFHWMASASYKRIAGHIVYKVSDTQI